MTTDSKVVNVNEEIEQSGASAAPAAPPGMSVLQADIGTPGRGDEESEISDMQGATEETSAAASSTTRTISGVAPPLSRKRGASREPHRERQPSPLGKETPDLKALTDIIQALQNSLEDVKDQVKQLRAENEMLKTGKNDTTVTEKGDGGPMKPLSEIDKKDVEKPGKYKGDPMQWRIWTAKFKAFLARRDQRWPKLIDAIQERSEEPLKQDEEMEIFKSMDIDAESADGKKLIDKFKDQFQEYLDNYTEGTTHAMVQSTGPSGVLEAFRQMCDEGHSKRERHLKKEYRLVSNPKQVGFDALRQAIANWETGLADYEKASGHRMDERTRLLCLEDLCPDLLQQHIASKDNLKTYAEYKAVINDYLIERKRWATPNSRGKINWLGHNERWQDDDHEARDDTNEDGDDGEYDVQNIMSEVKETIMALVKGKFQKKPKGKGKGDKGNGTKGNATEHKGKNNSAMDVDDPVCFECGEPMKVCGHSAKDCPVRKARVAAGGPERLFKGKGKGDQKGGKGNWPTRQAWNGFYPGPSQAQWRSWYPQHPPQQQQVQNGKVNLFEQPFQLSAMAPMGQPTPLQALLAGPGTAYSIKPKEKTAKTAKNASNKDKLKAKTTAAAKNAGDKGYEHVNKFQALAEEENVSKDLKVNILDAVKPPSRNRLRKMNVAHGPKERVKEPSRPHHDATKTPTQASDETRVNESSLLQQMLDFVNKPIIEPNYGQKPGLKFLRETSKSMTTQSLKPLTAPREVTLMGGQFEVLSSIVDSGATIPTMHPGDAKAYELQESEASRRGVEYEVANMETIPNLGEKKFAVLTKEGTLRGYQTQCAEVVPGKPLQAVRALLASQHAVCFGLGEAGDQHIIINKVSGEINEMRDDGINYIQDLLIIPPDKIEEVQRQLMAINGHGVADGQDFGRQGR